MFGGGEDDEAGYVVLELLEEEVEAEPRKEEINLALSDERA